MSTQINQQDSTATIYSAESEFQVLDSSYIADVTTTDYSAQQTSIDTAADDVVSNDSALILSLWTQINELLSNNALNQNDPLLLDLVTQLQQTGILPQDASMDAQSLLQFHQWFIQMPSDNFSDKLTHLEGMLLYNWSNLHDESPLDRVTVFDSINSFQQYSIYTQVIIGGEAYTLKYYDDDFIQYDAQDHSAFGLVFNHEWVDTAIDPVDYQNAHSYLQLSDDDLEALNQWLSDVFPLGYDALSDQDIIMTLVNEILESEDLSYAVDVLDQWDSIAQFLESGTGDCEEFSHLFYAAVQTVYSNLPDRTTPELTVLAGLVGTGFNQMGHSVVTIELDGNTYVVDLTGTLTAISSLDELPMFDDYQYAMNFQEVLRYTMDATNVNTDAVALQNFSTSTSSTTYQTYLEDTFQSLFGSSASFKDISSLDDDKFLISDYNSLIQKVIGLEMLQLIESGQTGFLNSIILDDLYQFDVSYILDSNSAFLDYQLEIDAFLIDAYNNTQPIYPSDFESLLGITSAESTALFNQLTGLNYISSSESLYGTQYYVNGETSLFDDESIDVDSLYAKLYDLGFIDEYGMIISDQLSDSAAIASLQSFLGDSDIVADILLDFLESRAYIFSDTTDIQYGDDPFENVLLSFDSLSNEILAGLTAATTPMYSSNPSPYVIGGYDSSSDNNSLFTRIDHQKLQQAMSLFFTLQNTIAAFLTVYFSISDMVSSIAAKLGDDNSIASSTAKQRQKMIQSFNSYTGGLNESINTMMDMMEKTVDKNNEARYQTANSQIDLEYSDFFTQLGNQFLSNQYEIEQENLKVELSQDYYQMQFDNRQSLQLAMLDVPNFGPNLMPSAFSSLFLNEDYGDLSSMQVWAALFANGVIDEYGELVEGVSLTDGSLLNAVEDDAYGAFSGFDTEGSTLGSTTLDPDSAIHMKLLLYEQNAAFCDSWESLSVEQKDSIRESVRQILTRHESSLDGFNYIDMNQFGTSQYLFSYMNMFSRSNDSTYSQDPLFTGDLIEDGQDFDFDVYTWGIDPYNSYGSGIISTGSLGSFEFDNTVTYQLSSASDFYQYQLEIDAFLIDSYNLTEPIIAADLESLLGITSTESMVLFDELIDAGYISESESLYGTQYYVNGSSNSGNYYQLLFSSDFMQYQAYLDTFLIDAYNNTQPIIAADFESLLGITSTESLVLFDELIDAGYISESESLYGTQYYVNQPIEKIDTTEADIWAVLEAQGIIDSNGTILKDADFFLNPSDGDALFDALKDLYPDYVADTNAEMIYNYLYVNSSSKALHLSQSASVSDESGSGFQIVNYDMVSMARKNLMMMNMTKRVYMSLVSSYTQFFEKIAGKLSKDATSSSHYGDWQSSLMESHLGLSDRQLATIQSNTISMVDRINDLHRHRLNIIKMGDPILRGMDAAADWSNIAGALLMLAPTPLTQFAGLFLAMVSSVLSLAESWRGYHLEIDLDQEMDVMPVDDDGNSGLDDVYLGLNSFFNTNLATSDVSYTSGTDGSIPTDVVPRSVVDYANAHEYINPDSEAVLDLLSTQIFPNDMPTDPAQIIETIHAYMNQNATYVSDVGYDDWASVDDVAVTLEGDCEDLANLEYSLILAAFSQQGIDASSLQAHAAYVDTTFGRQGHVFLTYDDGTGASIVLDPSLNNDGSIPLYDDYVNQYNVEDVFTYTQDSTHVLNAAAIGGATAGWFDNVVDDVGGFFGDIFDGIIPGSFIELFIPDFSDPDLFNGLFQVDEDDSSDDITTNFVGDVVSLMFDNFVDGISQGSVVNEFLGSVSAFTFREILEPLIMSFTPGGAVSDFASDTFDFVEDVVSDVIGDNFNPDTQFIQNLLTNQLTSTVIDLVDGDTPEDVIDAIDDMVDIELDDMYNSVSSDYNYILNSDSAFLLYQNDIESLLTDYYNLTQPITINDFTFIPEGLRQTLFDELISLGYIDESESLFGIQYYVSGVDQTLFEMYETEALQILMTFYNLTQPITSSDFESISGISADDASNLFDELINLGYIDESESLFGIQYYANDVGSFSTSAGVSSHDSFVDPSTIFGTSAAVGSAQTFFEMYEDDAIEILTSFYNLTEPITSSDFESISGISANDASNLFNELINLGYIHESESLFGTQYYVNNIPTVSPTLKSDYSSLLATLLDDQQELLTGTGGFFNQSITHGSGFEDIFLASDTQSLRVMLNQYNVGGYKDALRQAQEKLRTIFLLVKMVSDAISTLAANVGDENKVKVAAGLQKLFESNFEFLSMYFDAREQLLSHYQSAQNHNVTVNKTRRESFVNSSVKSATILPAMIFPKYGSLLHSMVNISQTITMYYDLDAFGGSLNPYSDYYLESFFDSNNNPSDFLTSIPTDRYQIDGGDQSQADAISDGNEFMIFDSTDDSLDRYLSTQALAEYRSNACDILSRAANTAPLETGGQLTLPFFSDAKTLTLDQNAFNEYRLELVELGMKQQKWMMLYIAVTSYMATITKSLRGDGKVGAQHLGAVIDIIEREVSHDLEELGRIQSMQETAISLNNQQYESLKVVERSCYEAVFYAGYFIFKRFAFSSMPVIEIITIKAFSNMMQGVFLSYFNPVLALKGNKDTDGINLNRVDDELDNTQYESSDDTDIDGFGYNPKIASSPSTIDYSGIHNYEDNYLGFANDRDQLILDSQYKNSDFLSFIGLSYQSVNWFEHAKQSIMLKKLFTQWKLMLDSGQSVAEAYQGVADELGAVTTSFSYSKALKMQSKLKQHMMGKNIDGIFNLASADVGRFNAIQAERFETTMQGVKYVLLTGVKKFNEYFVNKRDIFRENSSKIPNIGRRIRDYGLYLLIEFSEQMIHVLAGFIRAEQLEKMQEKSLDEMNKEYRADFSAGSSFSEALMYSANLSKANQKVHGDVIGQTKKYYGYVKSFLKDMIDHFVNRAKGIGKSLSSVNGEFMLEQKERLSKDIFKGNLDAVNENFKEVSAFLQPGKERSFRVWAGDLVSSFSENLGAVFNPFNFLGKGSSIAVSHENRLRQFQSNDSVWYSLRKMHAQLIRHGAPKKAEEFSKVMDQLSDDINKLDRLNSKAIGAGSDMIAERLQLLSGIGNKFSLLHGINESVDNYSLFSGISKKILKFSRKFSPTRFRESNLEQIANNIDAFALNGNIGYILHVNKQETPDRVSQQHAAKLMSWLDEYAKSSNNPKKIYQSIGDIMINLSNQKDSSFFDLVTSDSNSQFNFSSIVKNAYSDREGLDKKYQQALQKFTTNTIASQERGFKSIYKTLDSIKKSKDTYQLYSGPNGILQAALDMKNQTGAKRFLHSFGNDGKAMLRDWMLSKGSNKYLARFLAETATTDITKRKQITLSNAARGSTMLYNTFAGWYRKYNQRLLEMVDDGIDNVRSREDVIQLLEFAVELQKNNPSSNLKEIVRKIKERSSGFKRLFPGPNSVFLNYVNENSDLLSSIEGRDLCASLFTKNKEGKSVNQTVIDGILKKKDDQLTHRSGAMPPEAVTAFDDASHKAFGNARRINLGNVSLALDWKFHQKLAHHTEDYEWYKILSEKFPEAFQLFSNKVVMAREQYMKQLKAQPNDPIDIAKLPGDHTSFPFTSILERDFQGRGAVSLSDLRKYLRSPIELLAETDPYDISDTEYLQALLSSSVPITTRSVNFDRVEWDNVVWLEKDNQFLSSDNTNHFLQLVKQKMVDDPTFLKHLPAYYLERVFDDEGLFKSCVNELLEYHPNFSVRYLLRCSPDFFDLMTDSFCQDLARKMTLLSSSTEDLNQGDYQDIVVSLYSKLGGFPDKQDVFLKEIIEQENSVAIKRIMLGLSNDEAQRFLVKVSEYTHSGQASDLEKRKMFETAAFAFFGFSYDDLMQHRDLTNSERSQFVSGFYHSLDDESKSEELRQVLGGHYSLDTTQREPIESVRDVQSELNLNRDKLTSLQRELHYDLFNRSTVSGVGSFSLLRKDGGKARQDYSKKNDELESRIFELEMMYTDSGGLKRKYLEEKLKHSSVAPSVLEECKTYIKALSHEWDHWGTHGGAYGSLLFSEITAMIKLLPEDFYVDDSQSEFVRDYVYKFSPKLELQKDPMRYANRFQQDFLNDFQRRIFIRPDGRDYESAASIVNQISMFSLDDRATIINQLMGHMQTLIQHEEIAAPSRLIDVIYEFFRQDEAAFSDINTLICSSNICSSILKRSSADFLSKEQKQKFLEIMHYNFHAISSSGIKDAEELIKPDVISSLDRMVGGATILGYVSNAKTSTQDNFLTALEKRVKHSYQFGDSSDPALEALFKYSRYDDDELKGNIQNFIKKDLGSIYKYTDDFSKICARFVRLGCTSKILEEAINHLASDKFSSKSENERKEAYLAIQALVLELDRYDVTSRKTVFSDFFGRLSRKEKRFLGKSPIPLKIQHEFLFLGNNPKEKGLTKFQKQLAQEYVTAYFASKKSVFKGEYFWSAELASQSVHTLDKYMDVLFSNNKYKDVAPLFFKTLFFDTHKSGMSSRAEEERFYQRLIRRRVFDTNGIDSLERLIIPLTEQLQAKKADGKKQLNQFLAEFSFYFKRKSIVSKVKSRVNSSSISSSPSYYSSGKAQQLKSLIRQLRNNTRGLKVNQIDPQDPNNIHTQKIQKIKALTPLIAHLFVSLQNFSGSNSELSRQAKSILKSLPDPNGEPEVQEVLDSFKQYCKDLATPESVSGFMNDAIRARFSGSPEGNALVDDMCNSWKYVGSNQADYRTSLVALNKIKKLDGIDNLYEFHDILQQWAKYNRKYETGARTSPLSVGSTPGSLTIH